MPSAPEDWEAAARARLAAGLESLGLRLPDGAPQRLIAYVALLARWNRAYNLTAVRDPVEMVTRHLLDSLTALPHLPPGAMCDLGSGAGLPGIPLAVAEPARRVTLLEASAKRCRFLRQAVHELGLANVEVVCVRAEAHRPARPHAVVTARAVAGLAELVALASPLLALEGELAAFKGRRPDEELAALPPGWRPAAVLPLRVPGLRAERHLVRLVRCSGRGSW